MTTLGRGRWSGVGDVRMVRRALRAFAPYGFVGFEVAQALAAALGLAAEMAGVGAHEVALDLAAVAVVPGFDRAAMGDHRPQLGLELRRHGFRAVAGDVFAVAGPELPSLLAVLPPLGEQAHRAAAGELVERDLGLPVAGVAGGEIEAAGSLAVVAARPAALGPTCRPLAPRGEVAACGVGAEQRARRRAVLAERVVGDLEPVVAVAAAGGRFVLRRQRAGPGLAGVGTGVDEAAVEALKRGREPAKHRVLPIAGGEATKANRGRG